MEAARVFFLDENFYFDEDVLDVKDVVCYDVVVLVTL
jgi:hypothetical protein